MQDSQYVVLLNAEKNSRIVKWEPDMEAALALFRDDKRASYVYDRTRGIAMVQRVNKDVGSRTHAFTYRGQRVIIESIGTKQGISLRARLNDSAWSPSLPCYCIGRNTLVKQMKERSMRELNLLFDSDYSTEGLLFERSAIVRKEPDHATST